MRVGVRVGVGAAVGVGLLLIRVGISVGGGVGSLYKLGRGRQGLLHKNGTSRRRNRRSHSSKLWTAGKKVQEEMVAGWPGQPRPRPCSPSIF